MTWEILAVAAAVGLGAFIKAITGMGLPQVAIPILAIVFGPFEAVVIMSITSVVTNTFLVWSYRDAAREATNLARLLGAGIIGTPIGVFLLTTLSPDVMGLAIGVSVLTYLAISLWKPNLAVGPDLARKTAAPVGLVAGVLQGSMGLSGVVLASYIHALGLPRRAFVFLIAILFQVYATVQVTGFWITGAYTAEILWASVLATVVAVSVVAYGTRLAPRLSPILFHRLVLAVLFVSATKLVYDAVV